MVNANEREEREVEEAPPWMEQKGGRKIGEVDEEIEEEEEVDTCLDVGEDITFLWLRSSCVCLSRRERSLVNELILDESPGSIWIRI